MTGNDKMPQWLREIVDRGFKPEKIYSLPKGLFSFVHPESENIITQPAKYLFSMEGLPGSGKTSLLNLCKTSSVECVEQILPEEPKEEKDTDYFQNSEEMKTAQVLASKHNIGLLDRYYLSTLAYYWATDKIFGTSNYQKVFEWYSKSIESGKLIKPFMVFLIKTPLEKSFTRKKRTVDQSSKNIWLNPDFLNLCEDYNEYFYREIEPHTTVVRIDGNREIPDILLEINNYMQKHVTG